MSKQKFPSSPSPSPFSPSGPTRAPGAAPGGNFQPFGSSPKGSASAPWNTPSAPVGPVKHPWHVALTLVTLILTVLTAYLCAAFLPQDTLWGEALTYTLPAFVVLMTAFLMERATSAMTPAYSRKLQFLVALIGSLLVALIVLLCSVLYQLSFRGPLFGGKNQAETAPHAPQQFMLMLDKSTSMGARINYSATKSSNEVTVDTLTRLIGDMPDDTYVGLLNFSNMINGVVDVAQLTPEHRDALLEMVNQELSGATDFDKAFDKALSMLQEANLPTDTMTYVFMLTDGEDSITDPDALLSRFTALNARLYCIKIAQNYADVGLARVIRETGGSFVSVENPEELLDTTVQLVAEVTDEKEAEILYRPLGNLPGLQLAVLALRGVIVGVALMLMLSLHHQKRIQPILSLCCGVLIWALIQYASLPEAALLVVDGLSGLVVMRRNN